MKTSSEGFSENMEVNEDYWDEMDIIMDYPGK
jgi:hypothetical protein